jgi:hypothetical protein
MERNRYLLMKPAALLALLERAEAGENSQDLMFEVLDVASNAEVQLKPEDTDG